MLRLQAINRIAQFDAATNNKKGVMELMVLPVSSSSVLFKIVCVVIVLTTSLKVLAIDFDMPGIKGIEGSVNTTLSLGAAWRMDDRDSRHLSQANMNLPAGSSIGSPSNNSDDGSWNYDKSETYSKVVKGSTDFSLAYKNYGLVTSAKYFYDFELKDEARAKDDTGYSRVLIDDTLDEAGADIDLLNAYLYGSFDYPMPLTLKVGRQVVNWSEGLFMQGGVNVINPIDASAARTPGARLKEILLPVNLVHASLGLNDSFSMEAFYQLRWEATKADPCGTFFSTNDVVGDGCGSIVLLNVPDSQSAALISSGSAISPRLADRDASDSGQFGLALHWYLEHLNGSELGFYYLNYHSRLPYFSGVVANPFQLTPSDKLPVVGMPAFFYDYPEDIRLWGLSLATSFENGSSLFVDYSFRENLPIQWNSGELIHGSLLRLYSRHLLQRTEEAGATSPVELIGTEQEGYDRYKVSQLQLSTIKLFDSLLGANQLTFLAEAGAVYVHGFPANDSARYGRADALGSGDFSGLGSEVFSDIFSPFVTTTYSCTGVGATTAVNANPTYCDSSGYSTQFSWGYVLAMGLDYQAVFDGVNLSPEFVFSHDVQGMAPNPMGLFVEGRKSMGVTLNADYLLSRYHASVGYIRYFGGGRDNVINDRDFLSASLSVSF